MLLCAGIFLFVNTANAQVKRNATRPAVTPDTRQVQKSRSDTAKPDAGTTFILQSTGTYPARWPINFPSTTYQIGDPLLLTLDARANGSDIRINNSGIVGMPKRAYGFANGKLMLRSNGATTFGTQTGSGAVGTGTSLGTFGSNGPAMGLNGKSPYAGMNMWGNARNLNIARTDSAVRLAPLKKYN